MLNEAGNEWGPLGVAVAAAHLTSRDALMAHLEAERWQDGVDLAECFVAACDYDDIDPRGPVFVRGDTTPHYACVEHWEAIIRILGQQVGSNDEHRPAFTDREETE